MESPQSRHKWYHKKRESHTDLLHQLLLSHQCKGPEKKFLPSSAQGKIAARQVTQENLKEKNSGIDKKMVTLRP
jgi:hypothetical protein